MEYSINNNEKINNWIIELNISKQKINHNKNKNKYNKNHLIATDNSSINKEPESKLIDRRFDNVKD